MTDPRAARPLTVSLPYQPGIDGLRAVSVLAVLAYHLDADWALGGYLGVEVFFVVSGYLITSLLVREFDSAGRIRLGTFWARRARRLLPAVVLLIALVSLWTALFLPVGELRQFRGDAAASLLYVQNWYALVTDQPYFELFGRPSPFRHLWSLAIEEQFYLVWPVAMAVGLRMLGRRRLAAVVGAAAVASAAAMAATVDIAAIDRVYYGTDTRAFGLLIGALCAFAWDPARTRVSLRHPPGHVLDIIGALALGALAWQFAHRSEFDTWTFPWGLLLVDVCTVVVLVAVTHPAGALGRAVGAGPLQALGRRSYSIYLWHWPVIVFTRSGIDTDLTGGRLLVSRLLLVAILSEASYRFVECPIRDGRAARYLRRPDTQPWAPVASVGASLAVILVALVVAAPVGPSHGAIAGSSLTSRDTEAAVRLVVPSTQPPPTTAPAVTPTTAAPTPTTVPRPVPDVTLIGESVTLGGAGRILQYWGKRVQIDAVEGRSFLDSVALIEALAAAGRLTPLVIVHIGNNGLAPPGALDRVVAAVGPDRRHVLVNVRVPRRWQDQVNGEVARTAEAHPNVVLADWFHLSGSEQGLLVKDGVHLSDLGELRYRDLLIAHAP